MIYVIRRGAWLVPTSHKEPSLATMSPAKAGLISTEVSTTNLQSTLTLNVICELIFITLYIKTDTLCATQREAVQTHVHNLKSLYPTPTFCSFGTRVNSWWHSGWTHGCLYICKKQTAVLPFGFSLVIIDPCQDLSSQDGWHIQLLNVMCWGHD